MLILGIDPGLSCTGYGVVEQAGGDMTVIDAGVVRTDTDAPLQMRLATIADGVQAVIADCEPDVMVVEELYSKYSHPQTAILMGHARGVILAAAAERGISVVSYAASLVKRSLTGYGGASKEQIGAMVTSMLGLQQTPKPNDVTDALALCVCHGSPLRRDGTSGGELPPKIAEAIEEAQRRDET